MGTVAVLVLTAVIASLLWREFRLRNALVDSSDTFRYLANGVSLLEHRHPYADLEKYADFAGGPGVPRLAAYPNQFYSLAIAGLSRTFSPPDRPVVLWPALLLSMAATAAGFCFLVPLYRRFLPERDVWLGLAALGFNALLMTSLNRPLTDAPGWCLAMGLLALAACRPVSPWTLGALLGAALLFRMQALVLFPFLILLRGPRASARDNGLAALKAAAAAAAVVILFEAAMKVYVRLPTGAALDDPFGNATYYVRDLAQFRSDYGSLSAALVNFGRSLAALARPVAGETIGLALLLSPLAWRAGGEPGSRKQVRLLWIAAVAGTALPLLLYASENNGVSPFRYQIVSLPLFVLASLAGLNGLPAFRGRVVAVTGLKILLPALALAGTVLSGEQAGIRARPYGGGIRDIYNDFETLPRLLAERGMPADGLYLVKPTLQVFLPGARMVRLPAQAEFRKGPSNHLVDGILTTSRQRRGWKAMGPVIEDGQGVRFVRVYAGTGMGDLVIYRREPVSSPSLLQR